MSEHDTALDRILELSVLINDDMTRSLARDQLTPSRAHVLWVLVHQGPVTQRVLADALGVSARTMTGLIDKLVETGHVTREPHPTDRRATLVTFTRRGARIAAALRRDQAEFARILFDGMPARRLTGLIEALDDVLARLRAAGVTHSREGQT
jgi:DNA-binding MarR family transcriptional regulator